MVGIENEEKIIIKLIRRIDSANSADVEADIFKKIDGQDGKEVIIDAAELEYISSAGLRVLMKLQKHFHKRLEIRNVSRDVYDIFETTGFTELFDVKKARRNISVDGLEVIGRGFFGTVYRIDSDSIVKVYNGADKLPMIENEIKLAKKAFLCGLPTAIAYDIVKVGENYGSVFEMLKAKTFHELVQEGDIPFESVMDRYTDLLKLVHHTKPEKGTFPSYREIYLGYMEVIKECLTEAQYEALKNLLISMDEEDTIVHGDIQMKNVMMAGDDPMLIDMDTLGQGKRSRISTKIHTKNPAKAIFQALLDFLHNQVNSLTKAKIFLLH